VKYDPDGTVLWARTTSINQGSGKGYIALSADSAVYLASSFQSSFDIDKKYYYAPSKNEDILVIKLTADGDTSWVKTFGGKLKDEVRQMEINNITGNPVICGTFLDTLFIGDTMVVAEGQQGGFMFELDQKGDRVWAYQLQTTGSAYIIGITPVNEQTGALYANLIISGTVTDSEGTHTTTSSDGGILKVYTDPALMPKDPETPEEPEEPETPEEPQTTNTIANISGNISINGWNAVNNSTSQATVYIYTTEGVLVKTEVLAGGGSFQLSSLVTGLYHLTAKMDNGQSQAASFILTK